MSIKKKIKEIEEQIEILETNELSFDDQIKLFQTTKKKIDTLNNEIDSKTIQIKELEAQ
jgi:exonuclease VII small subunit